MDNNETNNLPNGAKLDDSLTDAVNRTAEQSEPEKATGTPDPNSVEASLTEVAASPVEEPDAEASKPAQKAKRTVKKGVEKVVETASPVETEPSETSPKKRTTKKKADVVAPDEETVVTSPDEKPATAVTEEQITDPVIERTTDAVPAEGPDTPSEAHPVIPAPTTREEVINQLRILISQSNNDIKDKVDALKQSFYKLQKSEDTETLKNKQTDDQKAEFSSEEVVNHTPDPLEAVLKELLNDWREKRAELIAEQEKQRKENLEKKLQVIESIKALTEGTEDIGRTLPEFRRLQQSWKEIGSIPQDQVNEIWKKYQIQVERFYDLLKINNEFREYDFKKNLELKTTLCENAEKLTEEPDVVVAFRQLQKLHEDWRETGPVAKEFREEIWDRFKNASSIINKNHQHFFERLKAAESENLKQKTAICEAIEAIDLTQLKTYKDWDAKTAEIIQLQEQWKAIGFAPKKVNNKVFDRFRATCDAFFSQKSDFYKASKDQLNQNFDKKKLLCEKAESLKDSTDWKGTADVLIRLQKEWKTIGPVPKKVSDSIWKRFITACDFFFEQKEKFAPSQKNEELKNLTAKKELITELESISTDMPEEEAIKLYKELIVKWNALGHVPFKEKDAIYKAWHDGLDKLTDRLNISKENRRLNKFQQNLDDMSRTLGRISSMAASPIRSFKGSP